MNAKEFNRQTALEIRHIIDSGSNVIRLETMVKERCEAYLKHKVDEKVKPFVEDYEKAINTLTDREQLKKFWALKELLK